MTGKEKNHLNLILDIIMLFTIMGVFMVKGELHEGFGQTLGILVSMHVIMHWKQIKVMFNQF